MFKDKFTGYALIVIAVCFFTSCTSKKDIVYFQDSSDFETLIAGDNFEPKFKVDDEVSIIVSTLNPEASVPFNLFRGITESGAQADQGTYLVDKYGEIDFPVLGKIQVAGLSPEELRKSLNQKLGSYLKDPIINIRLRNFTVTLLGAVNSPGTYQVIGEQVTILEALGLAGDLNIKGQRTNIMVIRDFNGTKVYNRIDLTSKDAFKNPAYYLTQNDVVYVEPNKSGVSAAAGDQRVGIVISMVSFLLTLGLFVTRI